MFRHFAGDFRHGDIDTEVVSDEDPLVMSEFAEIGQGNHLNEL